MEHWGYNQNYIQSALHTTSSSGSTVNLGGIQANDVSNTFHVYALEWTPTEMRFSLDGVVYYTYAPSPQNQDNWPFDADQYILLNVAMQPPIVNNFTESPMVIDYIRVYQQGPNSVEESRLEQQFRVFPNPTGDTLNIELMETSSDAKLLVYSPLGKLLHSSSGEQFIQLDWTKYPAGIYQVVLESGGERAVRKVVKQ